LSFTPIPAIDIRGGRCVRLVHGDFARETTYADDPVAVARRWQSEGAARLHVVDLEGARDGRQANSEIIRRVLAAVGIPVQVGGGVRDLQTARALLEAGADRVVIGTAAAEAPDSVREWVDQLGAEQLVVGVDARNGLVATHGWMETTSLSAIDLACSLARLGVVRVLHTDISRDGALRGPNVEATRALIAASGLKVLASGGVSSVADLEALSAANAEGAIIGTALYDGRLSLRDALAPFGQLAC
jgi:phosphoribosylformimino-5-aminoimidazole carboxamide ribotide isomerase